MSHGANSLVTRWAVSWGYGGLIAEVGNNLAGELALFQEVTMSNLGTHFLKHPSTSEVEYSDQELELIRAVDQYKTNNPSRQYPTWREVLLIIQSLGYRRVAEPLPLPKFGQRLGTHADH